MVVVWVSTLVGERIRVEVERGGGGTVADVAEVIETRLHLAQAEQLYVARGRRLQPSDGLAGLVEAGASREIAVHLVRRPDPGRLVSFDLRVAGATRARRVVTLRADASVCQVHAAALASLRGADVAIPGGSLQLMIGGKVLDAGAGLIAAEFGLYDGCTLFAVPSRRNSHTNGCSFCVRVKIPGVPAVQVNTLSGWCVRELKQALKNEISGHWEADSALHRRCSGMELSGAEMHFGSPSHGHSTRHLSDDDTLPPPERGSVYFVLPSEHSLDGGARLLLRDAVPQGDAGSTAARALHIRCALLATARAELALQLAAHTAQPDYKIVNGRRKQRSVKRSHSRRSACGCRGQAHRRVESEPVPALYRERSL